MGSASDYLELKTLDLWFGAQAVTAPATIYLALSITGPGEAGAGITEPAGNGYVRKAVTNNLTNFPSANPKVNGVQIDFATPTGPWGAVGWVCAFDASTSGNMLSYLPLGSSVVATADSSTDLITKTAHGLADGTPIFFRAATLPGGLTADTVYYVRDSTTNTFKVAATVGGTAIDITSNGTSLVYYLPKTINSGDLVSFPASSLSFSAD